MPGLLLLPVVTVLGLVALVLIGPVLAVLYFWSRHKMKKILAAFQNPEQEVQWDSYVESYTVETVEPAAQTDRQLENQSPPSP